MRLPFVVFDLDSTLTDLTHRLHLIRQKPGRWQEFFGRCADDVPIPEMLTLASLLITQGWEVEFWTGRPEHTRDLTEEWLQRYLPLEEGQAHVVRMRPAGDFRPDHEVKVEYLDQVSRRPDLIFEDRAGVTAAFRAQGLRVLQVAEGDY